ncbi:HlyD family secretion protein [Lichenifustis flavocetrariae]|uniref:HlyD family secretion protein n=1 Tax=Lichenifustis flavocetrariae TaxID=2949735 RepID=A0AA41Z4N8_9HYPH|nr:HlyD family secretion protein [Lichenifustis flavocetrariae]MCW6512883.1 HlyD family secretion protein [Lichenifustis flavocetrariae]
MDSTSLDRRAFDDVRSSQDPEAAGAVMTETTARRLSPEPVSAPLPATPNDTTSPQLAAAPAIVRAAEPAPPKRRRKGKLILAALLLAGLGGGGHYGWHWWSIGRFEETTDNAYLQADKVTVAPKVAGFVANVFVADNQPVRTGDVLAAIDDRDYRIAIAEAQADLEKANAQLDGYRAAVVQQQAQVESAKADVTNAEAGLTFADQEAKRYGDLLASGAGTSQRAQQTQSDLLQRTATLAKNRAALDAAQKQVTTYGALAKSALAAIAGAQAKLDEANLNLSYTTIRAPIDGVVGDRSLRVGQLVQAGTGLLTVVPTGRDIYLLANFKETQIGDMAQGQPVAFTVDAFGSHVFHGRVESFSPGTGAQFALLPPENATGNFTKVVQRVPVKISVADDPLLARLRPGLSVEATVETRSDAPRSEGSTRIGMAEPSGQATPR